MKLALPHLALPCLALPCLALLLSALAANGASAQTITFQPGSRDLPSRGGGLRVQVQMQLSFAGQSQGSPDDQIKQQEGARRALYEMAARECKNLKEALGGECRLGNLSVNTNIQDRRPAGPESVTATASATYEISGDAARP